jgi:hypothetical protein
MGTMKTTIAFLLLVMVPSLLVPCIASARSHRYGTYYGFGGYTEDEDEHYRHPRPRSALYPNGIFGAVFDKAYPDVGCITHAKAYRYDRTYDRNAAYCTGWKNGKFGISLDGKNK